jgi:tRNA-dihydrouridine synthase A
MNEGEGSSISKEYNFPPDCLSVAPMIQWTDRHWRYFMRQITRKTILYGEMTLDSALVYNSKNLQPFLGHYDIEQPLAIQLGGCDPIKLGEAAYLCESFANFHEINLNCGCPSNRAKKCGFGAELMLEPDLVQQICYEMKRRVTSTDITVKCRLGVTGKESVEDLISFINKIRDVGIRKVILHARLCILKGLSPAQNRTIPPLHPEIVHSMVELFPDMKFIYNGGIRSFKEAQDHLGYPNSSFLETNPTLAESYQKYPVSGVMIGREAYNNPFSFQYADTIFFQQTSNPCTGRTKYEIYEDYLDYMITIREHAWIETDVSTPAIDQHQKIRKKLIDGTNLCNLIKPLHNFFTPVLRSDENGDHSRNHLYKQKLDLIIKEKSKDIDNGKIDLKETILLALEDTISKEELHRVL